MKNIKKIFLSFVSLLLIGCQKETFLVNSFNIETKSTHFGFLGNFVKPELTIDGNDDEPEWNGENVSETLTYSQDGAVCSVKMFRGENALFFFFDVKDKYINSKGDNNGDDVSLSDSVEIYIDGLNNGGEYPQTDDYQINLGVNNRTRILIGSGKEWSSWNGLCQYEVKIKGTLNDNTDIDEGYSIEVMLPWSQINCSKDSIIGVAFGNVDKNTIDDKEEIVWTGVTFDAQLIEPQTPNNYLTYKETSFYPRGTKIEPISVKGLVVDTDSSPISKATIKLGEQIVESDQKGEFTLSSVSSTSNSEIKVIKEGYKEFTYILHSCDIQAYKIEPNLTFELIKNSSQGKYESDYQFVGECLSKTSNSKIFPNVSFFIKRDNQLGFDIKVESLSSSFSCDEQFELYFETNSLPTNELSKDSYQIIFKDSQIKGIFKNPKGKEPIVLRSSLISYSFEINKAEIYVPYSLFNINNETEISFTAGIWSDIAQDWSPLSYFGKEPIVEDPSSYLLINSNSIVINGISPCLPYDSDQDESSYVALGSFGGKYSSTLDITFSTILAFADCSNQETLDILFVSTEDYFKNEEKIELFLDLGEDSRTLRDQFTYKFVFNPSFGTILSGSNYNGEGEETSTSDFVIYKSDYEFKVSIPYSSLISLQNGNKVGLTFGLFNELASDWDGYGYEDTYRDPENPSLYVRVNNQNIIG